MLSSKTCERRSDVRKLMVFFAIFALAAVGCSEDDPTVDDVSGSPQATAGADESPEASGEEEEDAMFETEEFDLELELDDFYFEPKFIQAAGGSTATIELRNEGSVAHTFTIDALDVDTELQPDATKEIVVELGTESKVDFYCRFHRESQDMEGSFSLH
jgi:plastocyanin